MARMMDSMILDNYPPYTMTKITTSHRGPRIPSMKKMNSGISQQQNIQQSMGNGIRINLQKQRVPTQGENLLVVKI